MWLVSWATSSAFTLAEGVEWLLSSCIFLGDGRLTLVFGPAPGEDALGDEPSGGQRDSATELASHMESKSPTKKV